MYFQSSFKLANSLDLHEFILNAFSVIDNVNDITSKYDIFELQRMIWRYEWTDAKLKPEETK